MIPFLTLAGLFNDEDLLVPDFNQSLLKKYRPYVEYMGKFMFKQFEKVYYIDDIVFRLTKKFGINREDINEIIEMLVDGQILVKKGEQIAINLLANLIRNQIFHLIKDYPGIYLSALLKILDIKENHLLHHLETLVSNNFIEVHTFKNVKAFSLPNIPKDDVVLGIFVLQRSTHTIIKKIFNLSQSNIVQFTNQDLSGILDIPISTTKNTSSKLAKFNIFSKKKQGKSNFFYINPQKKELIAKQLEFIEKFSVF